MSRPKDNTNFFVDEPDNLPCYGTYLLYTSSETIAQSQPLEPGKIESFVGDLSALKAGDTGNHLVWSTVADTVAVWRSEYHSAPHYLYAPNFEPDPSQKPD
jgi:hypothetical protein